MRIALTHVVSPEITRCELGHLTRQPIDLDRALAQHEAYCDLLRRHGLQVIELAGNRDCPDSTFIEDTAVVLDELAILASMGTASRRAEVASVEAELARYRPLARIGPPATLEGGDVLVVDRDVFVGHSLRTNRPGYESLRDLVAPHRYQVRLVPLGECLHLKSAVTALDRRTLLVNPDWLDCTCLDGYRLVAVAADEPGAANCLRLGETIYLPAAYPQTATILSQAGYTVETLDISELMKAEAGLTCSSLIFTTKVGDSVTE